MVTSTDGRGHPRRPHFWAAFNSWFREFWEQTRKRPSSKQITEWFDQNAATVWPNPAERPDIADAKNHAKGLRTLDNVKTYFRSYRQKMKERRRTVGGRKVRDIKRPSRPTVREDWYPSASEDSDSPGDEGPGGAGTRAAQSSEAPDSASPADRFDVAREVMSSGAGLLQQRLWPHQTPGLAGAPMQALGPQLADLYGAGSGLGFGDLLRLMAMRGAQGQPQPQQLPLLQLQQQQQMQLLQQQRQQQLLHLQQMQQRQQLQEEALLGPRAEAAAQGTPDHALSPAPSVKLPAGIPTRLPGPQESLTMGAGQGAQDRQVTERSVARTSSEADEAVLAAEAILRVAQDLSQKAEAQQSLSQAGRAAGAGSRGASAVAALGNGVSWRDEGGQEDADLPPDAAGPGQPTEAEPSGAAGPTQGRPRRDRVGARSGDLDMGGMGVAEHSDVIQDQKPPSRSVKPNAAPVSTHSVGQPPARRPGVPPADVGVAGVPRKQLQQHQRPDGLASPQQQALWDGAGADLPDGPPPGPAARTDPAAPQSRFLGSLRLDDLPVSARSYGNGRVRAMPARQAGALGALAAAASGSLGPQRGDDPEPLAKRRRVAPSARGPAAVEAASDPDAEGRDDDMERPGPSGRARGGGSGGVQRAVGARDDGGRQRSRLAASRGSFGEEEDDDEEDEGEEEDVDYEAGAVYALAGHRSVSAPRPGRRAAGLADPFGAGLLPPASSLMGVNGWPGLGLGGLGALSGASAWAWDGLLGLLPGRGRLPTACSDDSREHLPDREQLRQPPLRARPARRAAPAEEEDEEDAAADEDAGQEREAPRRVGPVGGRGGGRRAGPGDDWGEGQGAEARRREAARRHLQARQGSAPAAKLEPDLDDDDDDEAEEDEAEDEGGIRGWASAAGGPLGRPHAVIPPVNCFGVPIYSPLLRQQLAILTGMAPPVPLKPAHNAWQYS